MIVVVYVKTSFFSKQLRKYWNLFSFRFTVTFRKSVLNFLGYVKKITKKPNQYWNQLSGNETDRFMRTTPPVNGAIQFFIRACNTFTVCFFIRACESTLCLPKIKPIIYSILEILCTTCTKTFINQIKHYRPQTGLDFKCTVIKQLNFELDIVSSGNKQSWRFWLRNVCSRIKTVLVFVEFNLKK